MPHYLGGCPQSSSESTETDRGFLSTASFGQENFVNVANEAQRERKAAAKPAQPMIHRRHVIRDFLNLFQ
jgi:hypothetical protein